MSSFKQNGKLTLVNYPTGYILKPQVENFIKLPEAEYLAMRLATICGIETVPYGLIKLEDNQFAYITKRIDRYKKTNKIYKIPMEDFCQLGNRLSKDKYRSSYEQVAKILDKYSTNKLLDKTELFYRILFYFLTGNSDMHLKNFSLIKENDKYKLSPSYDMVPVKIIMEEDLDDLALTLNDKKRHLRKNDFIKYGLSIGLNKIQIRNMFNKIINYKDLFIEEIKNSYLLDEQKDKLVLLVDNNFNVLIGDNKI